MEIKRLINNSYAANTYILSDNGKAVIIDPAGKVSTIRKYLLDQPLIAILLTHGHLDHVEAVDGLYDIYKCPVYVARDDGEILKDPSFIGKYDEFKVKVKAPLTYLDSPIIKVGDFEFAVYETPGHSDGSVCYKIGEHLFTGDTLFANSVGRTDLYSGSNVKLKQSLKLFKEFDKDTIVYPGHYEKTNLEYILKYNPFFE
jgi:hydroxyacylglutathione hydrolase